MSDTYTLRKFQRRAETIARNSRNLMSDLMDFEGRDPSTNEVFASDFADSVLCSAEELENYLEKWIDNVRDNRGAKKS